MVSKSLMIRHRCLRIRARYAPRHGLSSAQSPGCDPPGVENLTDARGTISRKAKSVADGQQ